MLPRRLLKILISTRKLCGIQSYTEPKKGFVIIEKKCYTFQEMFTLQLYRLWKTVLYFSQHKNKKMFFKHEGFKLTANLL